MIDLDSESHFIWQPLPINDVWLDTPILNSQNGMRTIFVGALDATKGWDEVKRIILQNPKIDFLVVSKYGENAESEQLKKIKNVKFFSRISQLELISLMDTCDFFLLGSPFETQCLAAMEASMRNLSIIMKPVGLLGECSNSFEFGYFSENLEYAFNQAIRDYSEGKRKNSRDALLRMKFTTSEIEKEWLEILLEELKESFKREKVFKQNFLKKVCNKLCGVKIVNPRA
jgi:glycosyltransferase involved in cell wall biosynthesis